MPQTPPRDRFIHAGRLQRAATARKPGYLEAHMKVGKQIIIRNQPFIQVGETNYQALRKEFALDKPIKSTASIQSSKSIAPAAQIAAPKKMPGPLQLARNAANAAGRVITAAAAGQPVQATDAVFESRMKICTACEFLDKTTQRCTQCGCYVAAKVIGKARLATEKCPEKKW